MKQLLALTMSLVALAVLLTEAPAQCRSRPAVHAHVAHAAAVQVDTVFAATFVPITVPAYSVGYAPPSAATMPELKQLLDEIRGFRNDFRSATQPQGGPAGPPPAPAATPDKTVEAKPGADVSHVKVFQAKCAACHDKGVADKKGGGFTLMDGGNLAALTDRDLRRIASQTYSGKMPRGGKITDEEVAAIMGWIDGLK